MIELTFYVPETHVDEVKDAVFAAGGGRLGDYDRCCWQVLGEGQFRALDGANPHIGDVGQLTKVAEYRVELVCEEDRLQDVVAALKCAHPYEEPAYNARRLLDV